jgi:hypothetical protein
MLALRSTTTPTDSTLLILSLSRRAELRPSLPRSLALRLVSEDPSSLSTFCVRLPSLFPPRSLEALDSPTLTLPCLFLRALTEAQLFYNSMTPVEKKHIQSAASFELGKVEDEEIQQKMIEQFNRVDHGLAQAVADELSLECPAALNNNDGRTSKFLSMVDGSRQGKPCPLFPYSSISTLHPSPRRGSADNVLASPLSLLCRYPKDRHLCR